MRRQAMTDEQFNAQQIDRLNRNLRDYIALSKKTTAEIVSQKGNDLRIKMFRAYRSHRWGAGKMQGGIALREFRQRGGRIKVRSGLKIEHAPETTKSGVKLNTQARKVWEELRLRQLGIGVLAASFLVRRWNRKATKLIRNVTGARNSLLAEFSFDAGPLSDTATWQANGFVPGLDKVSGRYRISATAMAAVSADIEKYLARKQEQAMRSTLSKA